MIETILTTCAMHPVLFCCAIFILFLLAGCNIPISIDLVIIGVAFHASRLPLQSAIIFFLVCYLSTLCSSSLAFYIGKIILKKGEQQHFFHKLIPKSVFNKNNRFSRALSPPLFFIGRFVPFGIRNILYISAGLTSYPFKRFIITDAIATFFWSGLIFISVFLCTDNNALFITKLRKFQYFLFIPFLVTSILIIWYNLRKKIPSSDEN